MIEIFQEKVWQMSFGERAALEGILCAVEPDLAVEIGTAEGGSLGRIAAHAKEVHSFDLVCPSLPFVEQSDHIHLHTGDAHQLLPDVLARFAEEGRNVDFVLVDGDHSTEGVRQDLEDLLSSRALARSAIVIHDINNEVVRAGVEAVRYGAWPKVSYVELDWVAGYLFDQANDSGGRPLRHEMWGGLGLVLVDSSRLSYFAGPAYRQDRCYPTHRLLRRARELVVAEERDGRGPGGGDGLADLERPASEQEAELSRLRAEAEHNRVLWEQVKSSPSWRLTAPLRAAKHALRGVRRRG